MEHTTRRILPAVALAAGVAALGWALYFPAVEPADMTLVNGTEIKTIDPAVVSGQPEGRVIGELFEGLISWHPETLEPMPGVAATWTVERNDDPAAAARMILTFHLRPDAYWVRLDQYGQPEKLRPVTAHDFVYSMRRFLDPTTGADYANLLYHVRGGEEYNTATVRPGDAVEVELPDPPANGPPYARGEVLYGKLLSREVLGENKAHETYTVEIAGQTRRFATAATLRAADPAATSGVEPCAQVLPDFRQVGIVAEDDATLRIELKWYAPFFLKLLGFYPLHPVCRDSVEQYGYPAWTEPGKLATNGPFLLQSRRIRDRLRLARNPFHWDAENCKLERVDFLAVQSSTTALNLYLTGATDYIPTVPASVVPELLSRPGQTDFQPSPYLGTYYYDFNTTRKPLDDWRVRKALDLALDKRQLVTQVTRANQIPTDRFVPVNIPDYDQYKRERGLGDYPGPDVPRAKQLLAEAGFPEGRGFPRLELLYNTEDTHAVIAQFAQAQWREHLGIQVELVNKEWSSYITDRNQKNYDIARAGWIGDYVDPMTFLDLFESRNPQNRSGFADEEYDRLMESTYHVALDDAERAAIEARLASLPAPQRDERLADEIDAALRHKRMELFFQAEERLMQVQAVLPIYNYLSLSMVRPWVKNFGHNIQDVHSLGRVEIDRELKRRMLAEGKLR